MNGSIQVFKESHGRSLINQKLLDNL